MWLAGEEPSAAVELVRVTPGPHAVSSGRSWSQLGENKERVLLAGVGRNGASRLSQGEEELAIFRLDREDEMGLIDLAFKTN